MANPTREDFIAAARARYSTQQQAPADTNEQGIFGDAVDMFQRGLGQTLGGDLETVGQLTGSQGIKDAGRGVSAWADGQLQEASTPMREAMGKQFFQENAETGAIEAGDAWADPRAWAGNFSTVLGQFVGLVGGTKGAGVLAKPALRGAGKLLAKDLVEGQARELVAKATVKDAISAGALDSVRSAYLAAPGEAAKRAVLDKAIGRLTSIGYGAHAGAMASGMRAQQAEQEARGYFNALGNDELNANPIYQQAYWELADGEMQGASIGDIRRAAIDSVAERAATDAWSDPRALTADFLSGMLTGAGGGVGGLLGKVGSTRAGAAVRGFAGEGATEAWQGGETQRAVNQAVQEWADETRDPMAGVLSAALNEGTLGGAFGGVVGGVHGPQAPDIAKPVVRVERRVVTGDEQMDDMIHGLDQRQAERGANISSEIDSMFAGSSGKLMPGQSDPVMDIPAYQRQAEALSPVAAPVIEQQAETAAAPILQADMPAFRQVDPIEETPAFLRQSIAHAGSETDSVFGPLKTMRITRGGKPFASEKEAANASRKGTETPVPLNGGGFGVAEIAEVERVQAATATQPGSPSLGDTGIADPSQPSDLSAASITAETALAHPAPAGDISQLAPAIDTGYREVIPATQPQAEVSNEQAPQVLAVGSEGQGDQLGTGEPAAAGAEQAIAGLTDRAGAGDRADLLASPPVPDGQRQNDQALTAPATDAGVVVSEVVQPEPAVQEPAAAPTPWVEAIDNPDGTITLKGEVPLIKQWAKDSGVKAIPGKGGMVVAKSSAAKVRGYVSPAASEPAQQIEAARAEVAPDPTEAQKEAGNYKKGHLTLQGMDIALENPKGSTRSGTDQDGKAWQSTMAHDYGYIKRTLGADGDHVDVFIGDRPDSETVYVVDQVDPKTGKFDEHKVMMGFASEPAALDGYLANYEKGWKGLSAIKAMPVEEFKRWVKEGDTTKPVGEQPAAGVDIGTLSDDEVLAVADELGISHDDNPDDARWGLEGAKKDALSTAIARVRNPSSTTPIKPTASNSNIVSAPPLQDEGGDAKRAVSFSKQAMAQGDKPAKALTRKEAELVTKGWFKQYRGASGIDVQIHATQAELETALGLTAKDGLIRRAAFDDDTGTLHVAADTIANPKRMREILRHEVLAHYGLANVLGDGEYTKLISRLIKSKKDPSMRPVWDWVNTHYADEDIGVQAEEVVAHLAELEMGSWGRGWDRVVAWVTRALRAVGFVPDGITAAETRTLIEGLGKKMRRADGGMVTAEGDRLWFSAERSPWGKDFPEVILHGRLADATGHPDYAAAKGGDDAAARRLVSDVLSPDAIKQLKKVIGNREAIALGVHAEEAVSRNAIPSAMADILGKVLGIEVDLDIMQAAKVGRTAQDGFGRLANQPSFDGAVRADKPYLIMDDTLTQGGTLANLKGYIENRGGEVLAATALTGKQYSAKIAIDSSTLEQLRDQYDGTGLEAWWHNRFGYGFDSLTESEGRYLLRAKDADKVRGRVTAAGPQAPARGEHESARDDGSLPPDGLKFSQSNTAADDALQKLNLGPKPDIIDKTKTNLDKLRKVERSVVKSWLDRFIKKANTELLDALAPIKYAEDAAGITDAADSGYVAARMATGAASTMQATMLYGLPEWKDGVIQKKAGTGEKDALLGIFSDLGADLHNWLGWMAGHRAELLMEQGRENLLSEQDIAALKGLGKGKEAKFMEAKARWNRLNAATLDLAQEAGLFTKEARSEFESEWYIPFFRESDDGDVIAPFKPKGIANQNAGIKKLKGGEANTNDLLENIFTSTSKLIDASMKNMAAQKTVWNLADTSLIEVVAKPNMMDWRALKNGKDLITVKLEGEDYMIRIDDPDLYRAMTFFDRQPFGAMVNVAAKAKRLLTAGVTASPEFMLRNFLRDSLSSWAISKDGFKPVIDSIKGVKKTLAMEGSTIDVMFSGASFLGGYVNGNDPTAMADSVRKSLRRKGMTPEQIAKYEKSIVRNAAQVKGVVADVWDKYSRYGEALENANREAVYAAAIKAGKSHAQAAFESKDLMDFSMLGAARFIQGASMVLPFFNARIQGLGKLSRELRDNPREIAKRAGMITAMSLGLLAMNWDDERYEELPDWDKDANWHFFVGDQHFRIPKPFEIGVMFGTIPERMVRAMGGKDTGAQLGKAVARAIGETFALNPTPQIVKPLVESYFNYDSFRGGPIENAQDLAVKAEARYNEQTSLLMRELGEAMGMSPKKLEHLLIGYTGTIGGYVMATADGLIRAAQPGESASWRADEIPLVKAVYRGTGPAKSTQHMEEFYRMLSEVNQLKRTVDQYRSEGLTDKANELLDEQGGILKSRSSLSRTQQQIRVLRNRIELLQRDRVLSADEKRRRIDELLSRRNDLVYQAVNNNRKNWE